MIVSVDIEADGPAPGLYSMVSLGAVVVEPELNRTFYATFRPISDQWVPDALKVSGFTRENCLTFEEPQIAMQMFAAWVEQLKTQEKRVLFMSDNAGFDWQFVNYYFHRFCGYNPFGFSPMSLTWLYKGMSKNFRASFKSLRKTRHSHNALDDATGNAEAMLRIIELGVKP